MGYINSALFQISCRLASQCYALPIKMCNFVCLSIYLFACLPVSCLLRSLCTYYFMSRFLHSILIIPLFWSQYSLSDSVCLSVCLAVCLSVSVSVSAPVSLISVSLLSPFLVWCLYQPLFLPYCFSAPLPPTKSQAASLAS